MNDVEEVKNKTDIVSIIGEHVRLTKAGRNFKGLCPFHEERTPSFMVSPEIQMYKCFGCGESGDVFTFLQKYEGMDFGDALRFLADKAGVVLKRTSPENASVKAQILEANKIAAGFYNYLLTKHASGTEGLEYIKEKRGINKNTIEKFNIGFAPQNASLLFNFLTSKKKINKNILEQSGLVFKTRVGYMDRFRERIIFPISNHRGDVVALAGRILPQFDTGKVGKYINSPETLVYHKSSSLYGLNITKNEIRKSKTAVVVEGELDLLSIWQAGVKNVVAIKGTAMTEEHVRILSRFAETLIMALDSDFAGDSAAIRGLSFAQNAGLEIKVVNLGDYKDPDEFVKADSEGFLKAIRNAKDAWEFVINVVSKRYDLTTGAGKAKASRQLVPVLSTIEDNIVRSHYLQKTALKLKVPVEAVNREVSKTKVEEKKKEVRMETRPNKTRRELLEEWLLVLYSLNKKVESGYTDYFKSALSEKLYQKMLAFASPKGNFEASEFRNSLSAELSKGYSDILMTGASENIKDIKKEIEIAEKKLVELSLKEELQEITQKISDLEGKGKTKKLRALEEDFQKLSQKLSDLA